MSFFNWFKKNKNLEENNEDIKNLDSQENDYELEESDFKNFKDYLEEESEENLIKEEELEKEIEKIKNDLEKIKNNENIFEQENENLENKHNNYNDNVEEIENNESLEKDLKSSSLKIEEKLKEIEQISEEETNGEEINEEKTDEQEDEKNNLSEKEEKVGFFKKIKKSLTKTRENILKGVDQVLSSFTKIDEELFEELEETLIMADIGVETSLFIMESVRQIVKLERITEVEKIKNVIVRVITEIMEKDNEEFDLKQPAVILVIGVNGVGKTTTIGKLTNYFKQDGKKVVLAAADTFRAAAIDQLEIWGKRNDVDVIKHQENSDPGAVVFDAIKASKARKADILICDTAGRLHNKKNLMEELKKISRIIKKEYSEAQIESFLVLDATTGQNALQQAKLFSEVADITGIILTKLDGTAKGGVIIPIKNELNIPVRFIGIGEGINDLRPFEPTEFASALFDIAK